MTSIEASVRRKWCRTSARRVSKTYSAVGTTVGLLDLKAQLHFFLGVALQDTHIEARVQIAWMQLLGNHTEIP